MYSICFTPEDISEVPQLHLKCSHCKSSTQKTVNAFHVSLHQTSCCASSQSQALWAAPLLELQVTPCSAQCLQFAFPTVVFPCFSSFPSVTHPSVADESKNMQSIFRNKDYSSFRELLLFVLWQKMCSKRGGFFAKHMALPRVQTTVSLGFGCKTSLCFLHSLVGVWHLQQMDV